MSASHPASIVTVSLARLSIAVYTYQAAWVRAGFQGAALGLLRSDVSEALRVAKAAGAESDEIQAAIRAAVREVAMPRANA